MAAFDGRGLGRRAAILGTTALAAMPASVFAQTGLRPDEQAFLDLSRRLTGRPGLDPVTAQRLFAKLSFDRGFAPACADLARTAQAAGSVDALAATLDASASPLAAPMRRIVAAWYTGVAGDGSQAEVIAYDDALMFGVVGDVVATPSYCRAGPAAWTARPPIS